MSLKKFLLSRVFLKHLIIAVVIIIILLMITMKGLRMYTNHGESYPVPDFAGLNQEEVARAALDKNVIVEIIDSVYINDLAPGVVVDQVPEAGFKVKENRVVFLTINANSPEQVVIPRLTDISFRQAQVLIENNGLQIGQISYQPSEYNDLVLKVLIDSVEVKSGEWVSKDTRIDLVIGRTHGNLSTTLPNLIGLSIPNAQNVLLDAMLNQGVLIYDQTIVTKEDSLNARVWKQSPSPKTISTITLGSSVDIWATTDTLKISKTTDIKF